MEPPFSYVSEGGRILAEKPFLSVDGQVALLESRNVRTDERTPRILLREGYYAVVNGYKAPFIDAEATKAAGDDRYKDGTTFNDLYALFQFDRALRQTVFYGLVQVEAEVRAVCAYTFSERHPAYDDYLKQENYASSSEYASFGLDDYLENLTRLQGILLSKSRNSPREPIAHYRENYGGVPLWVLANDMTFGNVEHFFKLMKPEEQQLVCRRITELTGRAGDRRLGYFDAREARVSLNTLVKVRNICAHDERLYCAKIGRRKGDDFAAFLFRFRRFISEQGFSALLDSIGALMKTYSMQGEMVSHVLQEMGLEDVSV